MFPAIDFNRSGTRKEDLLTTPDELQKCGILRKILNPMGEVEAMEFPHRQTYGGENQR